MRTIAQSYRDEGFEKGIVQGIEKGREEGIEKARIETTMKMLKISLDLRSIQDVTGLSMQEILKIKADL